MDRTVTFKQEETSGHEPSRGSTPRQTDRQTDRQSQCDFVFDFEERKYRDVALQVGGWTQG
jgi:hypothetical protein